MAVPYTFGSATTSIPLSQLDSNFATGITLGNTAIQLGNTVTTLNNMTLANVTISSGTSSIGVTSIANGTSNVTIAASGGNIVMATNGATAITINTSQNVTMTGTLTTAANGIAKASLPTGVTLQVLSNTNTATASTSSGTYVTTGQAISITPSSSSNKVLILFASGLSTLAANTGITFAIYRNSTVLYESGAYTATVSGNLSTGAAGGYLDSPATTSATTYEIFFKETALAGTVTMQNRTLTVMEIAG